MTHKGSSLNATRLMRLGSNQLPEGSKIEIDGSNPTALPPAAPIEDSPEIKAAGSSPQIKGEIEFRRLNFAYNGVPVLHDINLRIPAGSSLAIVGPTGSGKTTLVSLIPRIYDAAPGSVWIDGQQVHEQTKARPAKAVVPLTCPERVGA